MINPVDDFNPRGALALLYPETDLSFLDGLEGDDLLLAAGEFLLVANAPIAEFFGLTSPETEGDAPFTGVSG